MKLVSCWSLVRMYVNLYMSSSTTMNVYEVTQLPAKHVTYTCNRVVTVLIPKLFKGCYKVVITLKQPCFFLYGCLLYIVKHYMNKGEHIQ